MGAVGLFSLSFTPVHTPPHHTSSSMADVSDSRLADAYAAVRSDSDPTTWAVAGYDKDAKDKIVLEATGTGSLDELAGHFHEDGCQFAYLRVTTGDEESKRPSSSSSPGLAPRPASSGRPRSPSTRPT